MNGQSPVKVLGGLLVLSVALRASQIYGRRSRERIPSSDSLEDSAVSAAFDRVAALPHFGLLRRLVIGRAIAMMAIGHAADLGCGPGHLVVQLARHAPGLHVTGIDPLPDMLDRGQAMARRAGLADRVDFRLGDAAAIPFPDRSLDLVVSTLSLHHWNDPPAALDEIARVLKPGGAYVVFDLRRDLLPPFYLLIWFATRVAVPRALRQVNEPLGSRDAAYTPAEAAQLAADSRLSGWRITGGPLWLTIEGRQGA